MQGFSVTDLCAWYGEKQVLSNINMQIPGQGVTAIIGPSGCGKSTFIRCLNRMHELVTGARMAGEIRLGEQRVDGDETDPVLLRRQVGMVFQKPNPFPTMSIRKNVLAGLSLTGRLDRGRADRIVEEALVGAALWDEVKDQLDAPGQGLSGGAAAASVHRSQPSSRTRRTAHGRAMFGARPDRNGAHRGVDCAAARATNGRDRDTQHATSGACVGSDRLLSDG